MDSPGANFSLQEPPVHTRIRLSCSVIPVCTRPDVVKSIHHQHGKKSISESFLKVVKAYKVFIDRECREDMMVVSVLDTVFRKTSDC